MEGPMVEFDAEHAIQIDEHVTRSAMTGVQNVFTVPCLVNTGTDIIDGALAVVMNADCNGYTVRVDDGNSGVPIGQVRSDVWLPALGNCVNRVNNGHNHSPIYVEYDILG